MSVIKMDKKVEEKIQNNENDIVDLFGDIEKSSKIKNSHLSLDKAKAKLEEVSKSVEKLKVLVKSQEKLLAKWDAS